MIARCLFCSTATWRVCPWCGVPCCADCDVGSHAGTPDPLLEAARRVLRSIPAEFARLGENLCVRVEDERPRASGLGPGTLAYYRGHSLRERSVFAPLGWPDEIVLLRGPIERVVAAGGGELEAVVRICLLHELAHLVGLSHERMRELGYTFDAAPRLASTQP